MPKLSQPATTRKVQPAAQDSMFISYSPKGAVPPSEKAGVDFEIEMVLDAIDYHENGDETDPACCTGENPCKTRIFLVGRQRDLAKKALVARDEKILAEREEIKAQTSGGSGPARVADPATPAQIGYINTLVGQHDTSQIGTFPGRTLAQIQKGEEVSKGRASKLIEVLKRQPKQVEEIHNAATPAGPAASAAQLGFLRQLTSEQGEELRTSYTKAEASAEITRLLKNREEGPKTQVRTPATEGMYKKDGQIYKVQIAVHGSGRPYAKKLVEVDGEWEFVRAPGMVNRLTSADKMSLEEAKEFGKLYGTCCVCGRTLTKEESIAEGIGPVCAGKM
ncbi:hypothetical protein HOU95_gp036 [Streptomyces phage Hiyaa]|uniref:Uncharacterized protein n=1 Tax=Streptomyces phage Hiyaa TaxID=2499072 RepID=A0A3S9U8N5_9CAUD|nr:hypothetical protein HOU95_gp036 [Streptomyces phage Hiyaa]AZS06676.1 hypothetical protein SEA_HIYAA_36 [Streptomyces phage Hiyaa]